MKATYLLIAGILFCFTTYSQPDTSHTLAKAKPLIFSFVEEPPKLPDGDKEMMHFLQENIRYPKLALDKNIQGKVLVRFVVNEDGSASDAEVIRGIDSSLDAEAIRVINLLPKFIPGKQQGKPVKVFFNLPVVFKIAEPEATAVPTKINPDADGVYNFVEGLPNFPGGDWALQKFLHKNMKYPESAIQKGIEGKVLIRFIIDVDGSVTGVKVIRPLDPDLDAEAVRLITLLPKFTPGTQRGKQVKVYFNIPVVFALSDTDYNKNNLLEEKLQKDKYFKKATILANSGSYKEAAEILEKSISKFPDDYLGYDMLAECDLKIGKSKEACSNSGKAKALGSPYADKILKKNCQ